MAEQNFRKIYAMKAEREKRIKSICPDIPYSSGIYAFYRTDEAGIRRSYVGQAVKQPISKRLADHCRDRLNGRWDRFSWFGFYHIDETGKLIDNYSQNNFSIENLANTLEALLVEGLEPRQNRKSGNEFGMEFLQYEDEKFKNAKAMNLILEKFK